MSDKNENQKIPMADITVLGQHLKIPMNSWAFLCVLTLCALILGIFFLTSDFIKKSENPEKTLELISAGLFSTSGERRIVSARSYRFWTPCVETADSLDLESIEEEKRLWYVLDNGEQTLKDFGFALKNELHVIGYTRTHGFGAGTAGYKPGWSWNINVPTSNRRFTLERFLKLYEKYFHRDKDIYIEIIEMSKP